jgi:hypothetical protein
MAVAINQDCVLADTESGGREFLVNARLCDRSRVHCLGYSHDAACDLATGANYPDVPFVRCRASAGANFRMRRPSIEGSSEETT